MLDFFVENIENVEEQFRDLYSKSSNGDKEGYVLKVDGLPDIPDVSTLELTLKKERDARKAIRDELKKFKDIDPDKYNELVGLEKKIAEDKQAEQQRLAEEKGEYENLIKQLKEEHATQLATLTDSHAKEIEESKNNSDAMLKTLQKHMIGEGLAKSLAKPEIKGNIDVLSPHLMQYLSVSKSDDGQYQTVVYDDEKNIRYKNGNLMTIDDLVSEFKENPVFECAFERQTEPGGTGSQGNAKPDSSSGKSLSNEEYMAEVFG